MSLLEFVILLGMAVVTTYAAWELLRREREAWRRGRRLDVHAVGLFFAACGTVVLWVKLASGDTTDFEIIGPAFAVVVLYLLLPDPRLSR